jgi:hypothetical protein
MSVRRVLTTALLVAVSVAGCSSVAGSTSQAPQQAPTQTDFIQPVTDWQDMKVHDGNHEYFRLVIIITPDKKRTCAVQGDRSSSMSLTVLPGTSCGE